MPASITCQRESALDPAEFKQLLIDSTLGERRPVDDLPRIEAMARNANLIVTARDSGRLVGVARSLSDFSYCTYLSDLAVHQDYQKQGIGRELVKLTKEAAPQATLILLAAPKARDYYPQIGMEKFEWCYLMRS
jgi:predicted N-acetyltransferase YhbS